MPLPFADEVATARAARASWCQLTISERLRPIRSLRNLIAQRADALIGAVEADIGRPAVEVLATELLPAASALKFLEQRAKRVLAPHRIGWRLRPIWLMGCGDVIHRRPWGVVGVIGTWNYPVYLNVGPIAQALVAGNAVLWKPSENAPRTADLLHSLFLEAGFPPELFQKLPATREAGPMLAEAEVDRIVFTGSETVGRKLAAKLGERLIPSTLELSGCDAMFVLADANLELAAKAAWFGVTLNRGQTCIAVRRMYIQRTKYEAFEDAVRKLSPNVGPMELVTAGQAEQSQRLIEDAVKRGARALEFSALTALTPQPPLPGGEGEPEFSPSPPGRGGWGVRAVRAESDFSPSPPGRGGWGVRATENAKALAPRFTASSISRWACSACPAVTNSIGPT